MKASDRAFSLFVQIYNEASRNKPKDPITGTTTSDVDVQFDVQNFNRQDPLTITSKSNREARYTVLNSVMNEQEYVNYQGNSPVNDYAPFTGQPDFIEDISLPSIIKWTQDSYPSMKLINGHFAYLDEFGRYPANRLMILRRFSNGIENDLFSVKVAPNYTLATWYDPEDMPISVTFNEKWSTFKDSFMSVLEDIVGIKVDTIPGIGKVLDQASGSPLSQEIFQRLGQGLGIITSGDLIYGDPNVIYEAATRDVGGEDVKSGLEANIDITFEATYVQREIGGVDSHAAFLMVIAECVHMGTSNSRFYVSGKGERVLNNFIRELRSGNVDGVFKQITDGLKAILIEVKDKLVDAGKALIENVTNDGLVDGIVGSIGSVVGEVLKNRYQRYKWKLIGAVGALTGMETAPWHITMGNPKSPWFMCGNLVLESAELILDGELSYNDTPTKLTIKYKLRNGRALGANEITALYNKGKGRIYDTIDKLQTIVVPSDAQVNLPGQQSQSNPRLGANTGVTAQDNADQVNTDRQNTLSGTGVTSTGFALNNTDIDNNLPKTSGNKPDAFGSI